MNALIDTAIYWLPVLSGWMAALAVFLKKAGKKAPKPTPAQVQKPWVVDAITEEQVRKEDDDGYGFGYWKRETWGLNSPAQSIDMKDCVLVRVRRRYPIPAAYEKAPQLRIGAVAVGDSDFDTKLAELRGFAEERAATLNNI